VRDWMPECQTPVALPSSAQEQMLGLFAIMLGVVVRMHLRALPKLTLHDVQAALQQYWGLDWRWHHLHHSGVVACQGVCVAGYGRRELVDHLRCHPPLHGGRTCRKPLQWVRLC
jgi:hypothetical protein